MGKKQRALPRPAVLAALVLLAALLLSVGSAYARYRSVHERPIGFETGTELTLKIVEDELDTSGQAWVNRIVVHNDNDVKLEFTPRTMVSLGIGSADHAEVTLSVNGQYVCTGTAASIESGSFLYDSFGPGWYFWYDCGNGSDLVLELEPNGAAHDTMTLEISISLADSQGTPVSFPDASIVRTELIAQR